MARRNPNMKTASITIPARIEAPNIVMPKPPVKNPDAAANLILFAAFGTLIWYLWYNDLIGWGRIQGRGPGGSVAGGGGYTFGGGGGAQPGQYGGPPAPGSAGWRAGSGSQAFPSIAQLNGTGVAYDDVVRAFTDVLGAFRAAGYVNWADKMPPDLPDPAATISSVEPYRGRVIPASIIPPQAYVDQYNRSMAAIQSLREGQGRPVVAASSQTVRIV